jgi:hypothetical protein
VLKVVWPQVAVNYTYWPNGPNRGKNQVFLLPGAVIGPMPLYSRLTWTVEQATNLPSATLTHNPRTTGSLTSALIFERRLLVTKGLFNPGHSGLAFSEALDPAHYWEVANIAGAEEKIPVVCQQKKGRFLRTPEQADSVQHDALERVLQSFGSSAPWASKKSWVWGGAAMPNAVTAAF